jgi:hypothetical protein
MEFAFVDDEWWTTRVTLWESTTRTAVERRDFPRHSMTLGRIGRSRGEWN